MNSEAPAGFVAVDIVPGFSESFGPIWINCPERRFGFRVARHHANPTGVCHGGALATFADYQIAPVQDQPIPLAQLPVTVSLSMDFLATAKPGDWVEGDVVLLRRTRTLTFTQTVLKVGDVAVARSNGVYRNRTDLS